MKKETEQMPQQDDEGGANVKTLVLVCRRGFCQILDRALRAEGVSDFQHGYLRLVSGSSLEARVGGNTEVLVVSTDAERAEKLITALRACPIRVEAGEVFELYTVGDDWGVVSRA